MGRFQGQELARRVALGEGDAGHLGPQGRPERHFEGTLELEGAAGALLDQALDVVLVPVRVEGQRENGHPGDQQDDQREQHPERNFQYLQSFALLISFAAVP
jgi:hypothetical protein